MAKENETIDAAHKREIDELKKQVGNAAKLRDALVQVQKKINYLIGNLTVPNSLVANRMEINGIINDALAAPPRNCDVGTAEELAHRFHQFCMARQSPNTGVCVLTCPCCGLPDKYHCMAKWAQMPYEPEEGGDR